MKAESLLRVVRFVISGGLAAATNIGTLYILASIFGVWYLTASITGFLTGFIVSFTMQKFWTFRDHATDEIGAQFARYFAIVLVNLGLNTLLVYLFVEYLDLAPVLAQIVAALIIAVEGYFAYKWLVFHKAPKEEVAL